MEERRTARRLRRRILLLLLLLLLLPPFPFGPLRLRVSLLRVVRSHQCTYDPGRNGYASACASYANARGRVESSPRSRRNSTQVCMCVCVCVCVVPDPAARCCCWWGRSSDRPRNDPPRTTSRLSNPSGNPNEPSLSSPAFPLFLSPCVCLPPSCRQTTLPTN